MTAAVSAIERAPVSAAGARSRVLPSTIAWAGVCVWILVAPFESTRPLLHLPGQSISSVEAALLMVSVAWGTAAVLSSLAGAGTDFRDFLRTPLSLQWAGFLCGAWAAALCAPALRANALHMAGRFTLAFGVFVVTVNGITTRARLMAVFGCAASAGVAVALLAALEYLGLKPVLHALTAFRPGIASIGAQVRAAGPLQYPTIASMFLEIAFACTLALVPAAVDHGRRRYAVIPLVALAFISEGVILTFTRSGLITVALSLALVGVYSWRERGFDRVVKILAVVACLFAIELLASRSLDVLRLRMTTETQDQWYEASFDAPADITLGTGATQVVTVSVTNDGLSAWDSQADYPIRLSYHWLLLGEDRSIDFEGLRTDFAKPVEPGETVNVAARVRAPGQPGEYRLMWDVAQEGRMWFSSQPDAELSVTRGLVTGPVLHGLPPAQPVSLPKRGPRPGRFRLWIAATRMWLEHPLLGVGPDNFRLLYGSYARIVNADPRVHTNNMYIEVLVGAGVLGAALFAWLCWSVASLARSGLRRSARTDLAIPAAAIAAACLAIAVHGLTDSFLSFTATYVLFAIVTGSAVACDRLASCHAHRI